MVGRFADIRARVAGMTSTNRHVKWQVKKPLRVGRNDCRRTALASGTMELNRSTLEAAYVRSDSRRDRSPVRRDMGGVISVVKTIWPKGAADGQ